MPSPTTATKVLPLHLYGALQAWGAPGVSMVRMLNESPTKSAIVGLMAAALGRPRSHDNADLFGLEFAVRRDRTGHRLWDYHTVRLSEKTDITYREYMGWAGFTAFVTGDDELVGKVYEALQSPVFDLSLGRRNCVPVHPVGAHRPLRCSLDEAVRNYWPSYAEEQEHYMVWRDARPGEAFATLSDKVVGRRRFMLRPVVTELVERN